MVIGEPEVREVAERHLGVPVKTIRTIGGGYGHDTFVVDERWVFRFAKTEAVAKLDRKEQKVLPIIDASVSFQVPRFDWVGSVKDVRYLGYRLLPGRPLVGEDVPSLVGPSALGELVHELHSVDIEDVSDTLGGHTTGPEWQSRYRDLEYRAAGELIDVLDQPQRDAVQRAFDRFFDASFRFESVVVHGDLGTSHILVDDDQGLVGLLDFEAVRIGDPAVDFVGFIITLGPETCRAVVGAYPGSVDDGFWERVLGYWWIGSLYAVFHGVATSDASIVASGIDGLARRLSQLAEL